MQQTRWKPACSLSQLSEEQGLSIDLEGHRLALFLVDGSPCAISDLCPHGNARLSEGWVEDGTVECPLHQARFDLRTGRVLCGPAKQDAQRFGARVQGGEVMVAVPVEVQR